MFNKTLLIIVLLVSFAGAQYKPAGAPVKLAGDETAMFARPVWSPDGDKIAYTTPHYAGLWIMRPDGADAQQICKDPAAGYGFQWSPDSRALLTRISRMDGNRRLQAIKLINVAQKSDSLLIPFKTGAVGLPRWSLDGRQILVYTNGRLQRLESGLSISALARKPLLPQCLLNGDQAVAIAPETASAAPVSALQGKRILNLVTSIDGNQIAFEIMGGPLCVMNSNGTGLVELGEGQQPSFSPDGRYIAYMITRDDGHTITASDLYIICIDGTGKQSITQTDGRSEMSPNWSPRGNAIVYDIYETGEIWKLPIVGAGN